MAFFRVTCNRKHGFATVHNYGCCFRCPFCSYKLRSGADGLPGLSTPAPERFLTPEEIRAALLRVRPARVFFMGGEPTLAPELPELLDFAKHTLGAVTRLGHTNGSRLPLADLDGANVGFKAWDPAAHLAVTGRDKELVYGNFERAFAAGTDLAANLVFVPGLIDLDQLEGLAGFLAGLSAEIPFHIMGYIPVPGASWRRPEEAEMAAASTLARRYLKRVECSHLTAEEALDLSRRDDRFRVEVIAGA